MADPNLRPEPEVAIVFTPEPWVGELHRFLADHGGARVREIVMDQRLALEDSYEILVVSHRWPALTRSFVKQLHEQRKVLLGVFDGDEPTSKVFLANLGADAVVGSTASMPEFLQAIQVVAPAASAEPEPELAGLETPTAPDAETPGGRGRIIVMGGPSGSGRTEIACALQHAAGAQGTRTVLVDADDIAPSIAQRLGVPIEPNLRTAIDATAFGLGDLSNTVHATPDGAVLCGLPNVAAWAQVRPSEVVDVITELAQRYDAVIVDIGPQLENLDCAPRNRYDVARDVLRVADRIVLVAAADPRGIARSLNWAADLRSLAPEAPVHAVLNFAPRDRFRRAECADELSRSIGLSSLHTVPRDTKVERAHWDGTAVGRSAFSKAMAAAAATVLAADPEPEAFIDLVGAEAAETADATEELEATA